MVTLYTIHVDGIPAFLPRDLWNEEYEEEQVTPTEAKLSLEDNKSGSLSFSVLPENLAYDSIELICSTIKVTEYIYNNDGTPYKAPTILWKGRAIFVEEDINGVRSYTCEGALAFLNDIICYPINAGILSDIVKPDEERGIITTKQMQNEAFRQGLQNYLDTGGNWDKDTNVTGSTFKQANVSTIEFNECIYTVGRGYNSECPVNRKINAGRITIANMSGVSGFINGAHDGHPWYPTSKYPNGAWFLSLKLQTPTDAFASALDQILDITVNTNGGHIYIRHEVENGEEVMYLDYLAGYNSSASGADYGVNIIDFKGALELDAPVTDIIPRGAVISTWGGTAEISETITDTGKFSIGDQVRFKGTRHYVASTSDLGYPCTPGKAEITNIAVGAKHPYALVHVDNTSTVYGWVDQSDIEPIYASTTKTISEFSRRWYRGMPYTEYVGITDGYEGGTHLVNETLMAKYGRIQQIVDFPDIDNAEDLKEAGEEWLHTHSSFLKQSYTISMIDLGRIYGENIPPIHLLDAVHVSMPKYSIDEDMPITKLDIDLLNPANTTVRFSRESTIIPSTRRRMARSVEADPSTSLEFNRPSDSLTDAMARNSEFLTKLDNHANINTSVSQRNKSTLPNGKTGNIDVVVGSWVDSEGNTHVTVEKMTFVNGLLCSSANSATGPELDFFTDIIFKNRSVLKPANKFAFLEGFDLTYWVNPNHRTVHLLFGEDKVFSSLKYQHPTKGGDVQEFNISRGIMSPYPYYMADANAPEAEDLILDVDYDSLGYGLYYRLVDGEKHYWPSPCVYYLPSTSSSNLFVFYARPLGEHEDRKSHYAIYTQKIANLGYTTKSSGSAMSYTLESMYKARCVPILENELKRQILDYQPTNGYMNDLVKMSTPSWCYAPYRPSPSTALLIIPFCYERQSNQNGLYVSPAIVIPSAQYHYINGTPYPKTMKIYTAYSGLTTPSLASAKKVPESYYRHSISIAPDDSSTGYGINSSTEAYMADMTLAFKGYTESEIATNISDVACYVFSSQEDLDAMVADYKTGEFSQEEIYRRHRDKIVAINNSYNKDESQRKVKLSYVFNNKATNYSVDGSHSDPFYPF